VKKFVFAAALLFLTAFAPAAANAVQRNIYPDPALAHDELAAALKTAAATHKRVIMTFGGNWCPDCQVLDLYMHQPENQAILEANYILIHINIGRMDQNLDIAAKYQIPLDKGVPAVAVLNSDGRLLYSQRNGEFESMRRMQASAVTDFLHTWMPATAPCKTHQVTC